MGCYWFNRWYHHRLREADRRFMIPVLLGQVSESDHENREEIFKNFIWKQGQEHWLCECSVKERYAIYDVL